MYQNIILNSISVSTYVPPILNNNINFKIHECTKNEQKANNNLR